MLIIWVFLTSDIVGQTKYIIHLTVVQLEPFIPQVYHTDRCPITTTTINFYTTNKLRVKPHQRIVRIGSPKETVYSSTLSLLLNQQKICYTLRINEVLPCY